MKTKHFFACAFLLLVLFSSCQLFPPEEPQEEEIILALPTNLMIDNSGIPDWYPSTYVKLAEKDLIYDSVFQAFKLEYNIDSTARYDLDNLGLCSHLYTCDFWTGVHIADSTASDRYLENDKKFVEIFIKKWWRLLSLEGFEINTIDSSTWRYGAYNRYTIHVENQYDYPIWNHNSRLGLIKIQIDSNLVLRKLSSSLAPHMPIPQNPMVNADSARQMIVGYPWHYYGFSGQRVDCVVNSSEISSVELNVYIERNSSAYIYRLIWCVSTSGLPVDFIIDAMTGEFLGYYQKFVT